MSEHTQQSAGVIPAITLATVMIAGMKHYVDTDLYNAFMADDIIDLRLEPTNSFDDKAVEVLWLGAEDGTSIKVGYIPRPLSQAIFALIKAGYDLQAEITEDRKQLITISMRQ